MKWQVYNMDCVQFMGLMPEGMFDLVVTSPPYDNLRDYKGYSFDADKTIEALYRVMKPGGVVVWVVGDATVNGSETGSSFKQALKAMSCGFRLHDTMIWNKGSFSAVGALASRYAPVFEYMFVWSKGAPKTFNPLKDRKNKIQGKISGTIRQRDGSLKPMSSAGKERNEYGQRFNIWECSPIKQSGEDKHPAPFPESLVADHIYSWSNPGDMVFDPFCGSGTTGKICKLMNRMFVGTDISEEYCVMARKRIAE